VGLLPMRAFWIALGTDRINRGDGISEYDNVSSDTRHQVRGVKRAGLHAIGFHAVGKAEEAIKKT
jgi:hypothetical protein